MKKYSDIFSGRTAAINQVGRRMATTALFMVAAITMAFSQEPYVFIEGSIHKFSVTNNPDNTFAWSMDVDPYQDIDLDPAAYSLIDGALTPQVTVRFNDMDRVDAELVYLVVRETGRNGCSTKRALQIKIEPNNMYLEFAEAQTQECFNLGDYDAPLKVGMNFKDKAAGVPIPENLYPLKVNYSIRNVTDNGLAVAGNGGIGVEIPFNMYNDYSLLIPKRELTGDFQRTIEYELTITSVTDKYDTEITNNSGDIRLQIRIINHLPQTGGMDMAMAYTLTPIYYLGAK